MLEEYSEVNFFFLHCFWWNRSPYYFTFSSAAPQRTAYSEVPSQMAAHLRTGSPLQAGEIAGFEPRTAVLQSGVATNEPPLLRYEPPLLPMSHHCSPRATTAPHEPPLRSKFLLLRKVSEKFLLNCMKKVVFFYQIVGSLKILKLPAVHIEA